MKYFSLKNRSSETCFERAVINAIAPDGGLYFPRNITPLPRNFFQHISEYSNQEIALQVIRQFVGEEIPQQALEKILKNTLSFNFPLIKIENNISSLQLFHGPTMAFKDVGACFMAQCLQYFNQHKNEDIIVLVATSGDTGGAVANGFLKAEGIRVVIVYPSGKVSNIQEKQLTTLGNNITALEVDGDFDDCQKMVKSAFLDPKIKRKLTSANSINIARWLPQMFYFFFSYGQIRQPFKNLIFSVPSGNFGNICAGLMAKKLGLPINHFVASTNINDTVPRYLKDGVFLPRASKATISSAMDVGNPSNFIRIQEIFQHDLSLLKDSFSSYSFSDNQTKSIMKKVFTDYKHILEPHGAVGYLGLKKHGLQKNEYGVFIETAHPIKFNDVVEDTLSMKLQIPSQVHKVLIKEKYSVKISNYDQLKDFLNDA